MKIRWFAAGIAAVLITGGAATVAQRVITQKTRGVLPEKNDSAHADSRGPLGAPPGPLVADNFAPSPPAPQLAGMALPADPLPATAVESVADGATGSLTRGPMPVDLASPAPAPAPAGPTTVVATEAPGQPAAELSAPAPSPASDPAVSRATDPGVSPAPAEPGGAHIDPAKGDPVELVETFVERNRKEAESAIQALSTESENLKARLAKVEAALVRWHNFSRALSTDQPAAQSAATPAAKANWKRAEPEPPARPGEPSAAEKPPSPTPDASPAASRPEVTAPVAVITPTEDPAAPAIEPKPPEVSSPPIPENPPLPKK